MTNNWPNENAPGVPEGANDPDWHLLQKEGEKVFPWRWIPSIKAWETLKENVSHTTVEFMHIDDAKHYSYIGPVAPPGGSVSKAEYDDEVRRLEAMLDEYEVEISKIGAALNLTDHDLSRHNDNSVPICTAIARLRQTARREALEEHRATRWKIWEAIDAYQKSDILNLSNVEKMTGEICKLISYETEELRALVMQSTPEEQGWHPHNGGPCPVDGERWVRVRLREGSIYENRVRHFRWNDEDDEGDIIHFHPIPAPATEAKDG